MVQHHAITIRGGQHGRQYLRIAGIKCDLPWSQDLDSPTFIIDGGANIGIASLYFLNRYPAARVVAVEPNPANFEILVKNLAPYAKRVTLLRGAIWKSNGRLHLELRQEEWATRVRADEGDQSGSVEAFTLPALIAYGNGTVDLLKLDIEGSEREIFGLEAQQWLPSVRNIAIELHGKECADRFFDALRGYEYDLHKHRFVVVCRNLRAPAADGAVAPAPH